MSNSTNEADKLLKPKEADNLNVITRVPVSAASYIKRENIPILSGDSVYASEENDTIHPRMAGSSHVTNPFEMGKMLRKSYGCNDAPLMKDVDEYCNSHAKSGHMQCKIGYMQEHVAQENQCRKQHMKQ